MLSLSQILTTPMDAETYLQSQRKKLIDWHETIRRETEEKANDPKWRDAILATAEQSMQNLFVLPGTGGKPLFAGDPPAWNEARVPDEEYLWQLNRMGELTTFADAYLVTGDEKYAAKAMVDLMSWIHDCPRPPLDPNETDAVSLRARFNNKGPVSAWRVLEVGIRLETSWRYAYIRLLYSESMTPEIHEWIMRSMYEQAETLSQVSPIIWPNADHNHFLTEMMGLFSAASIHTEWNRSEEWVKQGLDNLVRCLAAQFTPEGGQIEGCPGYHGVCVTTLYRLIRYLREANLPMPSMLEETLHRAISYSIWTTKPNGRMVPLGDTADIVGGLNEQAEQNRQLLGDYGDFTKILPLTRHENPPSDAPGGIRHFKTLGHITARTGWTPTDSYFMFSCNTPVPNGHSHQDPMSFVLSLNGRDIVTDPSYGTYMDCDKRKMYKSPEYHSCLTFGGRPPFEYLSSWGFSAQKPGHTVGTYEGDGLLAGDASHENYAPNEHRRLCALLGKDVFVVCDDVKNVTGEAVRLYFHMSTPAWMHITLGNLSALGDGVYVYLPIGTKQQVVESTKSTYTDIDSLSKRLIATDEQPSEDGLYLTIFSAGKMVDDIAATRTADGIQISFTRDGVKESLLWKFGEYCKRM